MQCDDYVFRETMRYYYTLHIIITIMRSAETYTHTCELFEHTAHVAVHHYICMRMILLCICAHVLHVAFKYRPRIPRTGLFTFMRLLFAHLSRAHAILLLLYYICIHRVKARCSFVCRDGSLSTAIHSTPGAAAAAAGAAAACRLPVPAACRPTRGRTPPCPGGTCARRPTPVDGCCR